MLESKANNNSSNNNNNNNKNKKITKEVDPIKEKLVEKINEAYYKRLSIPIEDLDKLSSNIQPYARELYQYFKDIIPDNWFTVHITDPSSTKEPLSIIKFRVKTNQYVEMGVNYISQRCDFNECVEDSERNSFDEQYRIYNIGLCEYDPYDRRSLLVDIKPQLIMAIKSLNDNKEQILIQFGKMFGVVNLEEET